MNKRGDYNPNTINTENAPKSRLPWVLIASIIFIVIVILIGILISINFISFEDGKLVLGKSHGLDLKDAYINGEDVDVIVGRGDIEDNLTGIEFTFYKGNENISVRRYVIVGKDEEVTFSFSSNEIPDITSYERVSVAPIFASGVGEIVGKIDDTKKISTTPPSSGGGGGGTSGGSSGGTTGTSGTENTTEEGSVTLSLDSSNDLILDIQNLGSYNTLIYDWRKDGGSIAVLNMPFDTNLSSGNIKDYSTYGKDGTLGGGTASKAPTWTSNGIRGGAYNFDGNSSYISIPTTTGGELDPENLSVEAWFYYLGYNGGTNTRIFQRGSSTYGLYISTDNRTRFYVDTTNDGGAWHSTFDPINSVTKNAWTHVVGTYNGTDIAIYINGVLVDTTSQSGAINDGPTEAYIGTTTGATAQFFNGSIDELRIYNRSLSPEQIAVLYNSGVPKHDQIVSQEISAGEGWSVEITPNNIASDGASVTSNVLTPAEPPSTWIYPGQDIQSVVDAHPAGTEFLIKSGLHRMQAISPRDGDIFTGEPGTIMSGARLLTSFVREGAYWAATGQTQQGETNGQCNTTLTNGDGSPYTGCIYPEDLFFDDVPLFQVVTLGEVDSGEWYFDYAADKIYFLDDPTDHKVEISVTDYAFKHTANNVVVRNLTVEKYATPAQRGAIGEINSVNWAIENNEVRLNHGGGIKVSSNSIVRGNYVHQNGQSGILGAGQNVLIEDNEIAYNNNYIFYAAFWGAGGAKFVYTDGLIVRNNYAHHNYGDGLWTDIDNINTLYEYNTVTDNFKHGIHQEIGYDVIIRNNYIADNGWEYNNGWQTGSGIIVSNSAGVEIYNNTLINNYNGIVGIEIDRGSGIYGEWNTTNLFVHNNMVQIAPGSKHGLMGLDRILTQNNTFDYNTYDLTQADADPFWYATINQKLTESEWMAFGQDVNGVFNR